MKVGRLTLSDRASAGVYQDLSGPEIERVFQEVWGEPCAFVVRLLPDERDRIASALRELCRQCPLVITTGGTGPARRDVTPEATRDVLDKELPGFGEILRMRTYDIAPTTILSRATAGVCGASLIINLPGRPKAIGECLPLLIPAIREGLKHLSGE